MRHKARQAFKQRKTDRGVGGRERKRDRQENRDIHGHRERQRKA